jgi:hypothetical protein
VGCGLVKRRVAATRPSACFPTNLNGASSGVSSIGPGTREHFWCACITLYRCDPRAGTPGAIHVYRYVNTCTGLCGYIFIYIHVINRATSTPRPVQQVSLAARCAPASGGKSQWRALPPHAELVRLRCATPTAVAILAASIFSGGDYSEFTTT